MIHGEADIRRNPDGEPRMQPRRGNGHGPPKPNRLRNTQRNYEHYIALARAAALSGNEIEAENYYQHAEHFYRSMSADSRDLDH